MLRPEDLPKQANYIILYPKKNKKEEMKRHAGMFVEQTNVLEKTVTRQAAVRGKCNDNGPHMNRNVAGDQ